MTREAFLAAVLSKEGALYRWAADGPERFDCSGLICWGIYVSGGPDWRATHSAQTLWDELLSIDTPEPGDLAFYGVSEALIVHVMVVCPDGRVFGATRGDRTTTTDEAARARGAKVRFRSDPYYRPGFLGFRSIATLLDDEEKPIV